MDEALANDLETAIADAGAVIVRVQKYRAGLEPPGAALVHEAMRLGDVARRRHRQGTLEAEAARGLLVDARALTGRLQALLVTIRGGSDYATAVAAHAAGDQATLARLLPAIFAGLEPAPAPAELFHPVAWRRRGRPRPVADVVAAVVAARDTGLPAEGDDLSPGTDAALPAVVLTDVPPFDEPVTLRLAGGALGLPVFRLHDTGEYLVYTPRLRLPLGVRLATRLEEEPSPDDERYRHALAAALGAASIPVEDAGEP